MIETLDVPVRSHVQRMGALAKANAVRVYRKELKATLAAGGPRTVRDVLLEPRWQEETWKVVQLLLALPKVGRVKANRILQRERISPSKTVGGLSDRQRAQLLAVLPSGGRGTVRS